MSQHLYESVSRHLHYLVPAITLSELLQDSVAFSMFPFHSFWEVDGVQKSLAFLNLDTFTFLCLW